MHIPSQAGEILLEKENPSLKKSAVKLSTVFFLLYCYIAGGSYGIEDMVGQAGPGMAILLLVLLAVFWGLPYGMICAEMSSTYPEAGGIYVWVRETFGDFWGYNCGWWYTLMGFIDTAVYLVLAVSYIESFIEMSTLARIALIVALVVIFTYINVKGLEMLGASTIILGIISLIPFVLLTIMGFVNWQTNPCFPFFNTESGALGSFGLALVIGMWMYSGYEAISALGGEIEGASKLIPKGLMLAIPFVALTYILPTVAGVAGLPAGTWSQWSAEEGLSYVEIGGMIGGKPLMIIFVIGAVFANLAIYNDYVASSSRAPFVMAEDRLFPKFFMKVDKKNGTPYVAICVVTVATLLLAMIGSFDVLIVMDVFLYMFCLLLVFGSAVYIRLKKPKLRGEYRIPVGKKMFCLIAFFPIAICIVALCTNGLGAVIIGIVALLSGPITYYLFKEMYGGRTGGGYCTELSAQTKLCAWAIPFFAAAKWKKYKNRNYLVARSMERMMILNICTWMLILFVIVGCLKFGLIDLIMASA